jgi:SGNH domain (fused to AT3 domains)
VLRELHGKQVFITDDVPWFTFDASQCKYRKSVLQPATCTETVPDHTPLRPAGAHVLSTWRAFCDGLTCSMVQHGRLLYRDFNHLNPDGSRYAVAAMLRDPLFARATADLRRPLR